MKKITFLLFIWLSSQAIAYGQIAKLFYTTPDKEGRQEYLLHHLQKNTITYFSTVNPVGVLLEVKLEMNGKYTVSFPHNLEEDYDLEFVSDAYTTSINCTNPNGTKQVFYNPSGLACYQYGKGNAQEIIFTSGLPLQHLYFSSRFPHGVLLQVVSGNMMQGFINVSFPNDKKIYELSYPDATTLKCKNPDGSIQLFQIKE
jgi:hypothetical protein